MDSARKAGVFGTLAFAGTLLIGIAFAYFAGTSASTGMTFENNSGAIVGIVVELILVLAAAWRFKIGKGAFWGPAIAGLFLLEIFSKIISGTTNVGWMIFYAAVLISMVNGVRGAWARRRGPTLVEEDYVG